MPKYSQAYHIKEKEINATHFDLPKSDSKLYCSSMERKQKQQKMKDNGLYKQETYHKDK